MVAWSSAWDPVGPEDLGFHGLPLRSARWDSAGGPILCGHRSTERLRGGEPSQQDDSEVQESMAMAMA